MDTWLCPSMMCANFSRIDEVVMELNNTDIDVFHLDVMDGQFVPNFGISPQDIKAVRENTNKMIDVHLMIMNPSQYIDLFIDLGVDIIYIHPEIDLHSVRTLQRIKARGKMSGIVISPETSIEAVKELFPWIDCLLIMTVNPGFAGQKYQEYIDIKIEGVINYSSKYGFRVLVDGAISLDKVKNLSKLGVSGFVLGTASLFNCETSFETTVKKIRSIIKKKDYIREGDS